jgi:hypothetical protein
VRCTRLGRRPDEVAFLPCAEMHVGRCTVQLLCDFSTTNPRPLVPAEVQKQVFKAVHGLSHAGTRATKRLISCRFVWRGMAAQVTQWCRECMGCARGKAGGTVASSYPVNCCAKGEILCHVHVDLVGPLRPSARGHTHLLSVIDRTTRWPELFPLLDTSARTCADVFTSERVERYGNKQNSNKPNKTQKKTPGWFF